MKIHITRTIIIAALSLISVSSLAEARPSRVHVPKVCDVYIDGYQRTGRPMLVERYLVGYDRFSRPVWGYRQIAWHPRYRSVNRHCPSVRPMKLRHHRRGGQQTSYRGRF